MSEFKIHEDIEKYSWSGWSFFPDPRKGDYLSAPFGCGVYQLRNIKTSEYVLFGKGKHLAYRMTSLLPYPFGCGIRKNESKREYVISHISNIEYRTVSFVTEAEMIICENLLKSHKDHIFNS